MAVPSAKLQASFTTYAPKVAVALGTLLAVLAIGAASAQAVPILYTGGLYSQDFDTLANTPQGASVAWSDGATLPGWYANTSAAGGAPTVYRVNNGTFLDPVGQLYSEGTTGNSDRALGTQSSSSSTERIGVALTNTTGRYQYQAIVTYDGEQWRRINNEGADKFSVAYQVFSAGQGSLTAGGTWTAVPSLTFNAPNINQSGSVALNGNLDGNRVAGLTASISGLDWDPGEELWIRFTDGPSSRQHQLAVDNFNFTAVPEPSSLVIAAFGLLGLILFGWRRR